MRAEATAPAGGSGPRDANVRERTVACEVARSPALVVEWRPLAALAPESSAWRELSRRAIEPNVFYDPAFANAAAPVLGARVQAALVWSQSPTRLLGFFPFRHERYYAPLLPVVTGWTHPYGPLGTPLVDRDAAEPTLVALFDALDIAPGAAPLLLLPFVPQNGAFAAALGRVVAARRGKIAALGGHVRALLAAEGRGDKYLDQAASGRHRKEWRRQRRRLEQQGSLTVVTARDPPGVAVAMAEFCALEARGWKGAKGTAIAGLPDIRRFVEEAMARLAAQGMVRVDRLMLGDQTVAAAATLRSGDTAWLWKIAYDETFARASPGVQLTLDLTASLLADHLVRQTDSCAVANHPMIDRVWRERCAMADLLVATGPRRGFAHLLASAFERLGRAGISAAKQMRDRATAAARP